MISGDYKTMKLSGRITAYPSFGRAYSLGNFTFRFIDNPSNMAFDVSLIASNDGEESEWKD